MTKQKVASARLHEFIAPAFKELAIKVPADKMDEITDLVASSMVGAGRYFHNPEHIIHVGSGGDALSAVAAFFHDLVYYQVNQGVGLNVAHHISPFICEREMELYLRPKEALKDKPFALAVVAIFGYKPEQALPAASGQNEFLSALTAASVLAPFASLGQIVDVAVCIEATIPFRGGKSARKAPVVNLLKRLQDVNGQFKLGLSDTHIKASIRRAVKLANQDVSDFGGESATRFLKNTWELVPEINPMLRSPLSYTVEGYRQALQKMERFFSTLDPASVFQQFEGEPDEQSFALLCRNAEQHVETAQLYFRLKLVSLGMLEALSGTLGKNMGLPILMGELSNLGSPEDRVEKFLPRLEKLRMSGDPMERSLLQLLEKNKDEESEIGLKSSPLTAFLLRVVGLKPLLKLWPMTQKFFEEEATPRDLLECFPSDAVGYVSDAVSVLLQRRAHRISTFVGSLVSSPPA